MSPPFLALALALAVAASPPPAFDPAPVRILHSCLALRDPLTGAHSERVGALAAFLAPALDLDPALAEAGGRVHDLGKLALPDAVLRGTGPLAPVDRLRVRRHPAAGGELVRRAGLPPELVAAAAEHHERIDGKGYPRGLAGEAIAPLARVVSVADAIDAIVSRRSYKEARPAGAARGILVAERGKQFDARVVDYALAHWPALAALVTAQQSRLAPPSDPP